jgi:hypothetical protein
MGVPGDGFETADVGTDIGQPGRWAATKAGRNFFPEPAARTITTTERICQLTGEFDRTGWDGRGSPPFAFNRTETCGGIRGTDLGASFEHKGLLYFLFGDTWRVRPANTPPDNLDAIAFTWNSEVKGGISLAFNVSAPRVPGIGQAEFDVPLDGFSYRGRMFVFFSTGYHKVGGAARMGRSVLAVSDTDGYEFDALAIFSDRKFINVSVALERLSSTMAGELGWPAGARVLWVWGSGAYRASPPYVAAVLLDPMLAAIGARRGPGLPRLAKLEGRHSFLRFYAGPGRPWSTKEEEAEPLFPAYDIGELSCRWNSVFDSYFLTYNSSAPRGIVLRWAPQPWGPWSRPIIIFDPAQGYGRFMHVPWNQQRVDHVQDDMFLTGRRDNEWGGEYGPYQISRYTRGSRWKHCELYFVLSTWNPYQVVLMRTRLTAADLDYRQPGWVTRVVAALKSWVVRA